jgi:4-amino-4-deoxy-L-arabinose transferase-like glycosyltransferase
LIFSIVYKRWSWLKSIYFWLGIPLFFTIVAPWHIYETIKFGSQFWNAYFGYHILQRVTHKILGGDVTIWDYLKHFIFLNEPWFILSFAVVVLLLIYRREQSSGFRLALAAFFSALFIFLAFAVAKTKLMSYLVPILPFEAIAVAAGAFFALRAAPWRYKKEIFSVIGSVAFFIAVVSTSLQLFYFRIPYSYEFADDEREIGKLIKQYDRGHTIYSFDWRNYETIYYYSGKKRIDLIEKEQLKTGFPPPYFIIMPRPYLRNENQPGLQVLYKGQFLVLLQTNE